MTPTEAEIAAWRRDLLEGRVERLAELGVAARAALVSALQRGRTCSDDERVIRDVILATAGADLAALKRAVDEGDDHRDLCQLVFHDVDDEAVREAILGHFAAAAADPPVLRVLSDVDDTFFANWKDERYPKKTVYPGVRAFYEALATDRGVVTFVTARPGDRAGLVEGMTHETLRERGLASPVVLAGSIFSVFGNASIALKKLDNFLRYQRVWPEASFVFVGDSGQGDVAFGARMLEEGGARVRAVFIHDVIATPDAERAAHAARNVHFFDTYAGAAAAALRLGLVDRAAARRVGRAAAEELRAVSFTDQAARDARRRELERDLARLEEA